MYNRDHSNHQSGSGQEDIPYWARLFFRVFDGMQAQETANQRNARIHERSVVVASIVGRQAPLGSTADNGPVQLRNEISSNIGSEVAQRFIGNVSTECIELQNGASQVVSPSMEGRDDTIRRNRGPSRQTTNGIRRRNVRNASELNFIPGANTNDPSTRFEHITRGYEAVERLLNSSDDILAQTNQNSLVRQMMENFHQADNYRNESTGERREVFQRCWEHFRREIYNNTNQTNSPLNSSPSEPDGTTGDE